MKEKYEQKRGETTNQILLQAVLAIGSWLGLALGWLSGYRGKRRIKHPIAGIITNLGALVMIVPWIVMAFLTQPRFVEPLRTWTLFSGILLFTSAALLGGWSTPFIFPAAKKGGDELNPEFLVVKGPYQYVRHPQYVTGILAIIGLDLLLGAVYSLLLSPIFYLLFRFEAYLEESRVLEPKFGDEFRQFKKRVPTAFFGRIGTAILLLMYLAFALLVALP
jgi:protein-S-isoprenylcysteine O-methyltransferase Ste14